LTNIVKELRCSYFVIGKSEILFLPIAIGIHNLNGVIGSTSSELALRAASEMPPVKLGDNVQGHKLQPWKWCR